MPAASGDMVRVHYRGTLSDGTEFDSSAGREPLAFKLGEGSVIAGFDEAVTGLEVGGTRTVTIPPDQAYGEADEQLIQCVDADMFAEDPFVGGQVDLVSPDGGVLRGVITSVEDNSVVLDFNHPLAGQALTFEIELVEIVPSAG